MTPRIHLFTLDWYPYFFINQSINQIKWWLNRSLVAYLGASKLFRLEYVALPAVLQSLDQARYIFSSGFFLNISFETLLSIGQHCLQSNKVYKNIISIYIYRPRGTLPRFFERYWIFISPMHWEFIAFFLFLYMNIYIS